MDSTVIVAAISFAGTLIGTAGGIIASGKLTQYRIEQLEKKVDAHNNFTSRMPVIEEKIKDMNRETYQKIDDICMVLDMQTVGDTVAEQITEIRRHIQMLRKFDGERLR